MKNSGIPWIGDIPSYWGLVSISYLTASRSGGTPDRQKPEYWNNGTIPWVSSGEVNKGLIYETNEFITELGSNNSSAKPLEPNSVLVALNGQGKTKGMTAILKIRAACNQSLCAFQCMPERLHFEYLFFCFQAMYKFLRGQAGDTSRDGLAASFVKKQRIPIPPFAEQQAIAGFLEKKCGEIDEMVSLQEKIIEELKAYKQSVITEAVCKGLNPDVPLKDSGVDWIGQIPEKWECCKLKYRIRLINGRAFADNEFLEEGRYRILRVGNLFTNGKWYYSNMELEPEKYCEKGDLLYAWSASFGPHIWEGEKVIYHYHIWKTELNGIEKRYALYMLAAFTFYKRSDAHGTAMVHITMENMNKSIIPLPPIEEQQAIADYLDTKCAEIDTLISLKQSKIDTLKEYKKSIIYEYITGKKEING